MHGQGSLKDFLRSFVANWIRLLAECDHRVRLRRKQSRSRCQQLVFPFFAVAGSDFHGHRRAAVLMRKAKNVRQDRSLLNWFGSNWAANLLSKVSWQIRASGRTIRREGPRAEQRPPLNLRRYSAAFGRLTLDLPVVMIAQKMLLVPIIKCCFQEEPGHAEVSHLLETPVGCVHAAAHDGEFTPRHLLA